MTDQQDRRQRWAALRIVALFLLIPGLALVAGWLLFCEVCHWMEPLFKDWSIGSFLALAAGGWVCFCLALERLLSAR